MVHRISRLIRFGSHHYSEHYQPLDFSFFINFASTATPKRPVVYWALVWSPTKSSPILVRLSSYISLCPNYSIKHWVLSPNNQTFHNFYGRKATNHDFFIPCTSSGCLSYSQTGFAPGHHSCCCLVSSSRLLDIQTLHISSVYIHGIRHSKDIIHCQIPAQSLFLHFTSHLVQNHPNFPRPPMLISSVIQDFSFPLYNTTTLPTLHFLAQEFSNISVLDFYTDGSLLHEGTPSVIMGFA